MEACQHPAKPDKQRKQENACMHETHERICDRHSVYIYIQDLHKLAALRLLQTWTVISREQHATNRHRRRMQAIFRIENPDKTSFGVIVSEKDLKGSNQRSHRSMNKPLNSCFYAQNPRKTAFWTEFINCLILSLPRQGYWLDQALKGLAYEVHSPHIVIYKSF